MKTCIFGGTFDPPHIGHLLIAQTIIESENFDRLIFVPANISPAKQGKDISSSKKRLDMLNLALTNNDNFEISDFEISKGDISYTIDTITDFSKNLGVEKKDLYFLMGSDTLGEFHHWKDPKEIMSLCNIIVAIRPGFTPSDIPQWVLDEVHFANIPQFEISSTNIRKRWKNGKTIRYMVPKEVWDYINKNGLY
ncbi:MAG TPA: nicotinate-nucleotide adenylyltransferase [Candidatus Marinimicrobia bacterium]|nr:nicotinate-nucleotide adenylyltransferase [Candidatus Neomarinimicrobiota bacterium]|tara:strand:- start:711 stop:1292 length:582 start_codon:yes stop_codon:yes gene_type:complete